MARARMISKALSTSAKYASLYTIDKRLAEFCQALYPLLVTHADDWGRLAGAPFTIKHLVLPTSPRPLADFEKALAALDRAGLIIWFVADGRKFIQITDFDRHQSGLHKRTVSEIPEPNGNSRNVPENPSEQKGTELIRTEQNVRTAHADGFETFWTSYPRKVGKGAALAEWTKLRPSADLQAQILAAVERQRTCDQWTKDGGQDVPHPRTWLHQGRWEDDADNRRVTLTQNPKTAGNLAALQRFASKGTQSP